MSAGGNGDGGISRQAGGEAGGGGFMAWRSMLAFELVPTLKGPLVWAALAGLLPMVVLVRYFSAGEVSLNGRLIGEEARLVPLLFIGYMLINFLATLLTLCLCLDRTGAHYLRNNDLLVLSRAMGRSSFYLAKIASVFVPAAAYSVLALGLFWEELYRNAGVNLYRIFVLILPMSLGVLCLITLYFLLRNFLSNFMIFFLLLFILPIIYCGNLWGYYSGLIGEGLPQLPALGFLPRFGGVFLHALGMIHDKFLWPETWKALVNCGMWTACSVAVGLWLFHRKRL